MTMSQFLEVLAADAVLDRQVSDRARGMLASLEQGKPLGPNEVGSGPLFLDGLAVAYFPGLGLLRMISGA